MSTPLRTALEALYRDLAAAHLQPLWTITGEHVAGMHGVQERTLGRVERWMMNPDVFLKAPSSIVGPGADVVLPPGVVAPVTRSITSPNW